jgi:3'-phosphoadenosine 5'-phosphosulfate sulfotransferase (PAPS reductase)/FAD synthetase
MSFDKRKIAVWFSCGAASAIALQLTLKKYSEKNDVVAIYNPVVNEDEDNLRFLEDVEKWLGVKIERAINPKYPDCDINDTFKNKAGKFNFMSGPMGAPCTIHLKKKAREHWEKTNKPDWHVLGFDINEERRAKRFRMSERRNSFFPLIDAKYTKQDCVDVLVNNGIKVPRIYKLGYPNANCIGCVKASSPTYWNLVRKTHPDVFKERVEASVSCGAKLVRIKGERVTLDKLKVTDKGRPLDKMIIDCGIFCEEDF